MGSKPVHPRVHSAAVSQDGRRRRCGAAAARWTSQPPRLEVKSATRGRQADTIGAEERQQVDEELGRILAEVALRKVGRGEK